MMYVKPVWNDFECKNPIDLQVCNWLECLREIEFLAYFLSFSFCAE